MSDKTDPKDSGLVPVGNKALTTRSSALVQRGLQALASQQNRIVHFPLDRSMGALCVWDKDSFGIERIRQRRQNVEARGTIAVPPGKEVYLSVSEDAASDLSPLAALNVDDLDELTLGPLVDDDGLLNIRGLVGLKSLFLEGTRISDAGLANLQPLTNLKSLSFWGTQITDAGVIYLRGLTELEDLSLVYTRISGAGLTHLSGLTRLQCLFLMSAHIKDTGVKSIRELTNLKRLILTAPQVTDTGLKYIKELSSLEELSLYSANVTGAAVADLRRAMPNCDIHIGK